MTLNIQLDELFNHLITKYENENIPITLKIKDGIINEDVYQSQQKKILFICKEHNKLSNETDHGDLRFWMSRYVNYTFSNRIAEWTIGILNNFPPIKSIQSPEIKLEALNKIALINVKKIAGTSVSDNVVIDRFLEIGKDELNKQIEIINPTIIITCLGWVGYAEKLLGIKFQESDHGILIAKTKKYIVVDFYHPSIRWDKAATYYLLEKAFKK